MKYLYLLIFLVISISVYAEGTKELAPNANIVVSGRNTTDVAALHFGHDKYGNFANFDESETSTRLNIRVLDPSTECIMLGFGEGTTNGVGDIRFRFYIKDPDGNVVYQSDVIDEEDAQIKNWEQAVTGPKSLRGGNGYDEITVTSAELMSQGWTGEGDYFIEFEKIGFQITNGYLIPFWDITVVDCSATPNVGKTGRIWSEQWALFTPRVFRGSSVFDRPFNGNFYIVAPDPKDPGAGFVTKMDFNGSEFRAAAFTVALNSFGANNIGTLVENRQSVFNENTIVGEYPVFLNDPIDLYRTAELGDLRILGTEGCLPDNYCFRAISSEVGEIELLMDFDGEVGIFDPGTRDILINYEIRSNQVNEEICIPWDGVDGAGGATQGLDFDSITVYTSFRQGIYHFPVYDVEINQNGFQLEAVRPAGLNPTMYYDDRNIPYNSATGSPQFNLSGCETPCHTWFGATQGNSYGNDNTINSWWYARTLLAQKNVVIRFNKNLDTDVAYCEGSSVVFADSTISTPGQHVFYFVSRAGCDSVVRIQATEINLISEITTEYEELNCFHPEIELSVKSSTLNNGISYLWSVPEGQELIDASAESIMINTPGTYTLSVIEDILGCSEESLVEISEDFIEPSVAFNNDYTFRCEQSEARLELSIDNVEEYNTIWFSVDGNIVEESLDFSIINRPGNYEVTVQNLMNGCATTIEKVILRDTQTYLEIITDVSVLSGFCENTQLDIQLNSNAYEEINWSPTGVLSCDHCLSPSLFASEDKLFSVMVTDTNGCVARQSIDLQLTEDYRLYIPNAFSPNHDGVNDKFKLLSAPCAVDIVEFKLFDRWGTKVFERYDFESTDAQVGWDGRYNGQIMESGLYMYQVLIRNFKDEVVPLEGEIHLIR